MKNGVTVALFLIIVIAVVFHLESDSKVYESYAKQKKELQDELEQTRRQLQHSQSHRDSARNVIDSLLTVVAISHDVIDSLNGEIEDIKGRYDNVPQDSLGNLMNIRASENR